MVMIPPALDTLETTGGAVRLPALTETRGSMLPSRTVSAENVAAADRLLQRSRLRRAVRELEREEPELASYLMESGSRLYGELDRAVASYPAVRRLHDQAVRMTLVCIEAIRRSV